MLNSMLSSNQVLDISCAFNALPHVIDFAFGLAGEKRSMTTGLRPVRRPAWKVTNSGLYCLGSRFIHDNTWQEYPFNYDPQILSDIVIQWLKKQPEPDNSNTDGIQDIGARVRGYASVFHDDPDKAREVQTPLNCVICIQPYALGYDK